MAERQRQGIVIGGISQADPPPPTTKQLEQARREQVERLRQELAIAMIQIEEIRQENEVIRQQARQADGPQGPPGPQGPQGQPGPSADTSDIKSKLQTHTLLIGVLFLIIILLIIKVFKN